MTVIYDRSHIMSRGKVRGAKIFCLGLAGLSASCLPHGAPATPARQEHYTLPAAARDTDLFCVAPTPHDLPVTRCALVSEIRSFVWAVKAD
jgi:hypothetical protein